MNYIIWDRKEKLKGLDVEIWFKSYPQSREKTLVLIDDTYVVFLEDLKNDCYIGTDDEIVKKYIEDIKKEKEEEQEKEENYKLEIDELKGKIKQMELDNAQAIAELSMMIVAK